MNRNSTILVAVAVVTTVAFTSVGCSKLTEPFNDARIKSKDDSPAEVYSMPDGFNNVASKCDRHGNRMYVIYHSDSEYGAVNVVASDPSCKQP
ncbi:hypothetical protein [Actinomadura yumaensis]|uniref:Uncharacterized protein n=1 Tax=Actinomadura yumaensis TaxID=111807 RepID=A0ABW2CNU2_9ACTN